MIYCCGRWDYCNRTLRCARRGKVIVVVDVDLERGFQRFARIRERVGPVVALCDRFGYVRKGDDEATFFGRRQDDGIAKMRHVSA